AIGLFYQALLAMHTAGRSHPLLDALLQSAYWDRFLAGFLHSIAPAPKTLSHLAYLGPIYPVANYGDILRTWAEPQWIYLFAPLPMYDSITAHASRAQVSRWIATNALEGGAAKLDDRSGNIWGNSKATAAILSFMLFGPSAPPPPDPRPSLPRTFMDRP